MNAPVQLSSLVRHQFTLADVLDLIAQGLVEERVQLLDGDIYNMPSDGYRHKRYAMGIAQIFMARLIGQPYFVGVQTTLRLSPHNAPSPDIYVINAPLKEADVASEDILLVIEVADTSLTDNLTDSASRYARHGVREYWVVDVNAPAILVHRDPADGQYPPPRRVEADEALSPMALPGVAVRLSDIP
jgi:Uma2 family endonuclease